MSDRARERAQESWTVLELLRSTTSYFEQRGIETARLDAECLLAGALGCERLQLYVDFEKPIAPAERAGFRELVLRRGRDRVPVALLLGVREFWSLPFAVTSDVLVPRPETETLVSAALDFLPDPDGEYRVLDLGTGSGCVALALASERPKARVTASDISEPALQIAAKNAEELHLSERVRFLRGDLFVPVQKENFDLVVSNPPYVARASAGELPPELAHEPETALFGGEDGLDVVRRLVAGVGSVLQPGGALALEIDPAQVQAVHSCCRQAGLTDVQTLRDLTRRPRVVTARVKGEGADGRPGVDPRRSGGQDSER
jgi:release factor glutamine methyltransferase